MAEAIFIVIAIGAAAGVFTASPPLQGRVGRKYAAFWYALFFVGLVAVGAMVCVDLQALPFAGALLGGAFFGFLLRADPSRDRARESGILRELAECVRQRMPLHPHLEALMRESRGPLVLRLQRTALAVAAGCRLSEALAQGSLAPATALAAVRAGETGGGAALARTLDQSARDLLHERSLQHRLWLAIFYPLATWLIVLPFAFFMRVVVYEQFSYVLERAHRDDLAAAWQPYADAATGLLVASSLVVYAGLVLRVVMPQRSSVYVQALWKDLGPARRWFHASLPFFGRHWKHACLARAARTLGALVAAGVALPDALRAAAEPEIAGSFADELRALAGNLEIGVPLRDALEPLRLSESFKTLLLGGAAAGALPDALAMAADWHEARARRLETALSVLLPCVTIPLVGLFVASFYVPFLWMLSKIAMPR